jgi:hypothetical protein
MFYLQDSKHYYIRQAFSELSDVVYVVDIANSQNNTNLDYHGTYIIPKATQSSSMIEHLSSNNVVRIGVDEHPPSYINNAYVGGNHTLASKNTVTNANLSVSEKRDNDGQLISLSFNSTYTIIDPRVENSPNELAEVDYTLSFNEGLSPVYSYDLTAIEPIFVRRLGGNQRQSINPNTTTDLTYSIPYFEGLETFQPWPRNSVLDGTDLKKNDYQQSLPITLQAAKFNGEQFYAFSALEKSSSTTPSASLVHISKHNKTYLWSYNGDVEEGEVVSSRGFWGLLPDEAVNVSEAGELTKLSLSVPLLASQIEFNEVDLQILESIGRYEHTSNGLVKTVEEIQYEFGVELTTKIDHGEGNSISEITAVDPLKNPLVWKKMSIERVFGEISKITTVDKITETQSVETQLDNNKVLKTWQSKQESDGVELRMIITDSNNIKYAEYVKTYMGSLEKSVFDVDNQYEWARITDFFSSAGNQSYQMTQGDDGEWQHSFGTKNFNSIEINTNYEKLWSDFIGDVVP